MEGWDEPIFQGGRQVGVKRRYSDTLKALYQRGVETPAEEHVKYIPMEDVGASPVGKLAAMKRRFERQAELAKLDAGWAAADEADRMRAAGLCP